MSRCLGYQSVKWVEGVVHLRFLIHRTSGINAKPSQKPRRNAVMLAYPSCGAANLAN